jgi:lactoylglutathione lyase
MNARYWKLALVLLWLPLISVRAEPAADAATPASAGTGAGIIGPALRSTDLDRSIKFYTTGLGMVVATKLNLGSTTEVIFSFGGGRLQPVILLYKDETPEKSPPIDHGNGFGRVMLRVPDATALAARLSAAGYRVGDIHANSVNHMKVFWVEDPDGYKYEITELSTPKN